MGMVVSAVVSGGPSVLEDLDTPYYILLERKTKEKERKNSKSWKKMAKAKTVENKKFRRVTFAKPFFFNCRRGMKNSTKELGSKPSVLRGSSHFLMSFRGAQYFFIKT